MSELMKGVIIWYRLTLFTEDIIETIYLILKIRQKFVIN